MKCVWCNQDGGELIDVSLEAGDRFAMNRQPQGFAVHPEHEVPLRDFHRKAERYGRLFLAAIVGLLAAAIVVEVISLILGRLGAGLLLIGFAVTAIGGVLIALPFATPETVRWLGVRQSIRLTRAAGAVTMIVGLTVALLGLRQLG